PLVKRSREPAGMLALPGHLRRKHDKSTLARIRRAGPWRPRFRGLRLGRRGLEGLGQPDQYIEWGSAQWGHEQWWFLERWLFEWRLVEWRLFEWRLFDYRRWRNGRCRWRGW